MEHKRTLPAKQIISEIKSGATDNEIMLKYNLTTKGLQILFDKLLEAGLITKEELEQRSARFADKFDLDMEDAGLVNDGVPLSESTSDTHPAEDLAKNPQSQTAPYIGERANEKDVDKTVVDTRSMPTGTVDSESTKVDKPTVPMSDPKSEDTQEVSSSSWQDQKWVVQLLLFFCFPLGMILPSTFRISLIVTVIAAVCSLLFLIGNPGVIVGLWMIMFLAFYALPAVRLWSKKSEETRIQKKLEKKKEEERERERQARIAEESNRKFLERIKRSEERKREFRRQCFIEGPPIVSDPKIILKKGEVAHYCSDVDVCQQKTVTKTHRLYGGTRVRLGKLPLYFGGSTPVSTSKEVMQPIGSGQMVVTNQRVVLTGTKVNYSIKLSDINDLEISWMPSEDRLRGQIQIFSEGKYGGRFYQISDEEELLSILTSLLKREEVPKLLAAVNVCSLDVVKKLLEQGVDVNIKAEDGSTALMFACILTEDRKTFFSDDGDGLVLVRLLIEHGSDINAKRQNSVSALMIASENGFIEAVQILVEHKAEIDAIDDEGRTALIYAESEQHKEVVSFLLSHGASPSPAKG